MGSCERCGCRLMAPGQKRFCSKRCAGFRPSLATKTCTDCGETKSADAFRLRGGRPNSWCRSCEAARARVAARADPAKTRKRKAAVERRRRADPIIGPKLAESRRHYHRFRGSTSEDRLYAAVLRHDPCAYCGERSGERSGEVDHVVPSVRGGADSWENLTAACRSCNAQKNDRLLFPWIGERIVEWEREAMTEAAA